MSEFNADSDRRKFFRVRMSTQMALGPIRMELLDDPGFAVRVKHADLVDSLLELRKVAEDVLVQSLDRGIEYLLALQDVAAGSLDTRPFEERKLSVILDHREISLSEGGVGFVGEAPCELGEERTAVIINNGHPSRRPIPVRVRLVRRQDIGERTYVGFEFVDVPQHVQRQLVDMVFSEQRRQIREGRKT